MATILILDDNLLLTQQLMKLMTRKYHQCYVARNLEQAYRTFRQHVCDLAIIDRQLPDGDGLECVRYLHHYQPAMPVLVLSKKGSLPERVLGLKRGADEYLAKPFDPDELVLRIDNLLTKIKRLDLNYLSAGQVELHAQTGVAHVKDSGQVQLRPREAQILNFLMKHKNTIVSRQQLIQHLWQDTKIPQHTTVDVYVRRIRILVGKKNWIETIRGYGYIIRDKPPSLYSPRYR